MWRKPTGSRPPARPPAAGPPARALPFSLCLCSFQTKSRPFQSSLPPEVPLAHAAGPGRAQSFPAAPDSLRSHRSGLRALRVQSSGFTSLTKTMHCDPSAVI